VVFQNWKDWKPVLDVDFSGQPIVLNKAAAVTFAVTILTLGGGYIELRERPFSGFLPLGTD